MLNAANACLHRIQNFLLSDARKDHRITFEDTLDGRPSNVSSTDVELRNLPATDDTTLITVQNASFSWDDTKVPTVQDHTFKIYPRQFCFVIGPVGSGKSTLLKGLLGETPSSQGFVYTRFTTAGYVDQTPWIQNGTVQDNILGISTLDEPWYNQVVFACALEHDIMNMPRRHGRILPRHGNYMH